MVSTRRSATFRQIAPALMLITFPPLALSQLVAFTGKDSNSPDEFAFVALQEIADGTKIFFTESDYDNNSGNFSGSEGTLIFTVSGTLSTGTVVQISEPGIDTFTVTNNGGAAAIVGGNSWSATASDPHYAFSASSEATPWSTVTEVHAMLWVTNSAFGNLDPSTGTFGHPNAIVVDNGFASLNAAADYTGDRMATFSLLADSSSFTLADGNLDLTVFSSVPVTLSRFEIE